MEIYEKISHYIRIKEMTKKEFAEKLVALEPKSIKTGEIISEKIVYSYLTGYTAIKAYLIPYISDVLDITEQELFDSTSKTRKRCFKYFLQNAPKDELEYFNGFINSQIQNNVNLNFGKIIMSSQTTNEKLEKFSELLKYAPNDFIDKVISKLEEYEKLGNFKF